MLIFHKGTVPENYQKLNCQYRRFFESCLHGNLDDNQACSFFQINFIVYIIMYNVYIYKQASGFIHP